MSEAQTPNMVRVFKSTMPSMNYIFKNGKPAIFQGSRFCTNFPAEIKELEEEIAVGHPHIYIDPLEREIDPELMDPMKALRARIREEIIAEERAKMAAASDPTNNMGSTEQTALKPASSADVADAAAGGSGAQLAARVKNLIKA